MVCFNTKIAIVGAGNVGSTLAYTCMLQGLSHHIALIDIDKKIAAGQALDLSHCLQFTPSVFVESGDSLSMVADAQIVIICAGVSQHKDESRDDLLQANAQLFRNIIPEIVQHNSDCFIIVVTNPVDVLSYLTYKISKFPAARILGSGTVLDTARLRYLLGQRLSVNPKDVAAYVLGEHGDSEFIWWSAASIGGAALSSFAEYSLQFEHDVLMQTRNAAYDIIAQKGATYYAIALSVAKIIKSILFDQSRVFSVSMLFEDEKQGELFMSLPVVLKANSKHQPLHLKFNDHEKVAMKQCIERISSSIKMLGGC